MVLIGYIYLCTAIRHYLLTDNEIIIVRPITIFNKAILYSEIREIKRIEKQNFKWLIKVAASGGAYGHIGSYYNKRLGNLTMYATNLNNAIRIVNKKGKQIIITPNKPDDMIITFQERTEKHKKSLK